MTVSIVFSFVSFSDPQCSNRQTLRKKVLYTSVNNQAWVLHAFLLLFVFSAGEFAIAPLAYSLLIFFLLFFFGLPLFVGERPAHVFFQSTDQELMPSNYAEPLFDSLFIFGKGFHKVH